MPATPRAFRAMRIVNVVGAIALVYGAVGASSACSSSAKLVAAGGACSLASDCEEGLVCIPTPGASTGRSCSSDLSTIQETELPDTGPDTGAVGEGGTGDDDGAITTYPVDTGTTPVTDAAPAPAKDSGAD
jgi:hypothetical protein